MYNWCNRRSQWHPSWFKGHLEADCKETCDSVIPDRASDPRPERKVRHNRLIIKLSRNPIIHIGAHSHISRPQIDMPASINPACYEGTSFSFSLNSWCLTFVFPPTFCSFKSCYFVIKQMLKTCHLLRNLEDLFFLGWLALTHWNEEELLQLDSMSSAIFTWFESLLPRWQSRIRKDRSVQLK